MNELGYSWRQIENKQGISKHAILNYLHDPLAGTQGHNACRKLETSTRVTRQLLSSASYSLRSLVDVKAATATKAPKRSILRIISACLHIELSIAKKRTPCFPTTSAERLECATVHLGWDEDASDHSERQLAVTRKGLIQTVLIVGRTIVTFHAKTSSIWYRVIVGVDIYDLGAFAFNRNIKLVR